jgi:hypothetical protein
MRVSTDRSTNFDIDEVRKEAREIFQISAAGGRHYCYADHAGRVYMVTNYSEMSCYTIFEIGTENEVLYITEQGITDVGVIHGHVPEVNICMTGLKGKIEAEAAEFFISVIEQRFKDRQVDIADKKKDLREVLGAVVKKLFEPE